MQHLRTIFGSILPSAKWAYKILSASAETLLRHSFGSRYVANLWLGFFSCCIYMGIAHATCSGKQISNSYLVAFFCLVAYHTVQALRQGSSVHSRFPGKPWPIWNLPPEKVKWFQIAVEPSILFIVGLLIAPVDSALAVWLFGCAICLFVKGIITAQNHHHRLLDALDARLEGERMNNAVRENHAPIRQEQASTVVVSQQPRCASNIRDIVSHLDPALQRMVSEGNPQPEPPRHSGPLGHLPRITAPRRPK